MKPKLSILICSLITRHGYYLSELLLTVQRQNDLLLKQTEILINSDSGWKSIGLKRNELLASATGEYIVFIDDDDEIGHNYLDEVFTGIYRGVDHIGITMLYQPDNGAEKLVKCSKYHKWEERNGIYYRSAQHVCPIKAEIAKQVKYPEISFGEDKAYSDQVNQLIQTEHLIDTPIYFYKFRSNKKHGE